MKRAGLVAVACMLAVEGSAAAKGGAFALPPLEVDIGSTVAINGGQAIAASTEVLVGIHWASLYWHPTNYDIGIGYVGSFRPLKPTFNQMAERSFDQTAEDPKLTLQGVYLTLSHTLLTDRHFRTWVELRGELMVADTGERAFSTLGGAVRFAAELYSAGVGGASDHNSIALFAGTFALGVYVEASHRELASQLGPTGVTGGLSIRIPFLFVAAS